MNAVTEKADLDQRGLYHKFDVIRIDGEHVAGGKHHGDAYFPLNLTRMSAATRAALKSYVAKIEHENTVLAADLRAVLRANLPSEFVTVPETTLPSGLVVPSFPASRYLCTVDDDGNATVQADAVPTVEISYHDAVKACDGAGMKLIRETQALALAWNIYNVAENWTGGAVGEGKLFQGLRNDTVYGAQPNDFEPENADERRYFVLSNGERIYDVAGHLFTWVFDDVQGDERGVIAKPFTADSLSFATVPHPSMEKGVGWRPTLPCDWSGGALIRGGCWDSCDRAGVFLLSGGWPDYEGDYFGFRCTK